MEDPISGRRSPMRTTSSVKSDVDRAAEASKHRNCPPESSTDYSSPSAAFAAFSATFPGLEPSQTSAASIASTLAPILLRNNATFSDENDIYFCPNRSQQLRRQIEVMDNAINEAGIGLDGAEKKSTQPVRQVTPEMQIASI